MENKPTKKKKVWTTPQFYLIDTDDVRGGVRATFKEGSYKGSGQWWIDFNAGGHVGNVPKAAWSGYHHS